MKKKIIFIVMSIFLSLFLFIDSAFSFFSDMITNANNMNSGNLSLSIENFTLGTESLNEDWELHQRDENNSFNATISDDEIVEISFVVKNNGTSDISFNGNLELSWLLEASEANSFFLYPENYENSVIKENIAANNDAGSLIGFNANDKVENNTSNGVQEGYSIPLSNSNMVLQTTYPDNAIRFTYKLYFKDTKGTLSSQYNKLNNALFEIGIKVSGTDTNQLSSWTTATSEYGLMNTLIKPLDVAINLTLNGDNPMYITHNSVYNEPGATATDEYGNTLPVTIEGTVDTSEYGSTVIKYTAENNGLTETKERTVYVTDGEKPVITAKKSEVEKYIDPSISLADLVSVTDNMDTEIASKLIIETPEGYDPEIPGVYTITYNVTDFSGLSADPVSISITIFAVKDMKLMLDSTIILSTHGKVYSAGYNGSGQLAQGNTTSNYYNFTKIQALADKKIIQISTSEYNGLALTDDGNVYVWGYGANGMTAQGNGTSLSTPTIISELTNITKISSTYYTGLALNSSGEVFSWGLGSYGANGGGSTSTKTIASKIVFPEETVIKDISMGWFQGFALSTDNQVFGWGSNDTSELISPSFGSYTTLPVNITSFFPSEVDLSDIVKISSGLGQVYILLGNGDSYSWGNNGNGEVGNNSTTTLNTPTIISTFSSNDIDVKDIEAGYTYGLAADSNGVLYAWGQNLNNALGLSTAPNIPTKVESIDDVDSVHPYYNHSGIVTTKGYAYMVGYNAFGKLAIGSTTSQKSYIKSIILEDS